MQEEPTLLIRVSNSPCGVESAFFLSIIPYFFKVSNSPCGVESVIDTLNIGQRMKFLIHRVELKARRRGEVVLKFPWVSNSPCGVERSVLVGMRFFVF